VADSPPASPAVLFSTVVLVTLRVLSFCKYMPPPKITAVLPTTLDFSMVIPTPDDAEIPPVQSNPTTKRQRRNHRRVTDDDPFSNHSINPTCRVTHPTPQIMSGFQNFLSVRSPKKIYSGL
jgi:hypothetical protein